MKVKLRMIVVVRKRWEGDDTLRRTRYWMFPPNDDLFEDERNEEDLKQGCAVGRGPKMKNGPIDKILRIQLGLYIRKPGEKKFGP